MPLKARRGQAVSAGTEATTLDSEAVAAMDGVGLDISGQTPKRVDLFPRERVTFLVTLYEREIGWNTVRWYATPAMKSGSMSRNSFRNTLERKAKPWKSKK